MKTFIMDFKYNKKKKIVFQIKLKWILNNNNYNNNYNKTKNFTIDKIIKYIGV